MLISVSVDEGFKRIDYDPKVMRKAIKRVAKDVREEARKLISRKAVSLPGTFPGKDTGEMQRSIQIEMSKSGYSAVVRPTQTKEMKEYYPAFVVYGHRAPNKETATSRRSHRKRFGFKVALPRENFVKAAAERHRKQFETEMSQALAEAIKVGLL